MNEPRIYKYSNTGLLVVIIVFGLLLAGIFFLLTKDSLMLTLPFIAIFVLVFMSVLLSLRAQVIISEDEISTKSILGTKSLRWSDIHSASGSGYAIKLHNLDGDVTLAPSPQLPGYPEIIEDIGAKRPDLFKSDGNRVMVRSWFKSMVFLLTGLFFIGVGIFLYLDSNETLMPVFFLAVIEIGFIASIFMSVLSVRIKGQRLIIRYLLTETTLNANEIMGIRFNAMQTRTGKNYSISIYTSERNYISFSGIGSSLPVTYLVLKNWHKTGA